LFQLKLLVSGGYTGTPLQFILLQNKYSSLANDFSITNGATAWHEEGFVLFSFPAKENIANNMSISMPNAKRGPTNYLELPKICIFT